MKKLLLTASLAVCTLIGVNAQSTGFQAGAYVGIPMGDAKDFTSINLGVTGAYYWDIAGSFQLGAMTGYDLWTAKKFNGVKGDDAGFIPLAASAKYNFDQFFIGADLGYAIGASKNNDGGFLYQPKAGYSGASFDAFLFYKGISDKKKYTDHSTGSSVSISSTISSLGVGFAYKF